MFAKKILLVLGGAAIVIISFAATTYLLNTLSPESITPNPTTSATVVQPAFPTVDFSSNQWPKDKIIVRPKEEAPDGTNTAFRLIETVETGYHRILQSKIPVINAG